MRLRKPSAISVLPVAAVLVASCATVVEHRVEETIARELPRVVGPAARYDVDVMGARRDASEFKRVRVTGLRINRPRSPIIDRLDADLEDVRIDRSQRRLTAVGAADAQGRVLAIDVANFLQQRGNFDTVAVSLHGPDQITVSGRPVIAGIVLPSFTTLTIEGRLLARGSQLRLEVDELSIPGIAAARFWRSLVEQAVNPIVDLSALPIPTQITSVRTEVNALVVTASSRAWTHDLMVTLPSQSEIFSADQDSNRALLRYAALLRIL